MSDPDDLAVEPGRGRQTPLDQLIVATARGDRAAFEEVYRLAAAKLFSVGLRILGNRADAEEALQDCFIALWRNAGSFDPARGGALPWLTALARNRAIDRLRAAAARSRAAEGAALAPAAGLEFGVPDAALDDCIGQLPDRDRAFVRNAFFAGRTYAELAREAGLPLGTVKSSIRRALVRLRACLS